MDGGAWWAPVHGIVESQTGLSDFTGSLVNFNHQFLLTRRWQAFSRHPLVQWPHHIIFIHLLLCSLFLCEVGKIQKFSTAIKHSSHTTPLQRLVCPFSRALPVLHTFVVIIHCSAPTLPSLCCSHHPAREGILLLVSKIVPSPRVLRREGRKRPS